MTITRRRITPWLLVWLALVGASLLFERGVALQWPGTASEPAVLLHNALMMLLLPGWVASRLVNLTLGIPMRELLAVPLGWTIVLSCAWVMLASYRWAARAPDASTDPSRRKFLASAAGCAVVLPPGAVAASSIAHEPWSIRVVRHRLRLRGFGRDLGEFRVVNVTDTHLGTRVSRAHIERAYALGASLDPHFAVLTGDHLYNDASAASLAGELARPFASSARFGAFGVLGNHDWWEDGPGVRAALERAGVTMIDNGQRLIDLATGTPSATPTPTTLRISGLGDLDTDETRPDLALDGPARTRPTILLAHQPDSAEHERVVRTVRRGARVDAMLSGHTHGGQVKLPFLGTPIVPSRFGQKYAQGMVDGPEFPVIVSAGIGMSILPVRWGVRPEVTLLTIECLA